MTHPVMIPLSQLPALMGRSRVTVWRWLRRKGVPTHGRSVALADLRTYWPALADALDARLARTPPCPDCRYPAMQLCCPDCGFVVS